MNLMVGECNNNFVCKNLWLESLNSIVITSLCFEQNDFLSNNYWVLKYLEYDGIHDLFLDK